MLMGKINARFRVMLTGAALSALVVASNPALAETPADTLVQAWAIDDIITMDPGEAFEISAGEITGNTYDMLVRLDVNDTTQVVGGIAESWEVSEDGLTYTFKLKPGLTFASGNPITAEDVAWSFERAVKLNKSPAFIIQQFGLNGDNVTEKAKAVDPSTFVFTVDKSYAPSFVLNCLTATVASVVDSKLVKANEKDGDWGSAWLSKSEAGSGSYELKRYDPAIGFTAVRFADHFIPWGEKYFDEIDFRTVVEINSRVLGLMKGDFQDSDGYMPQDQIVRLKKADGIDVYEEESMRIFYAAIHNGRAPLDDVNFRKALSYAFDYDGFINNILSGSVARDPVPLPNNIWGAPKDAEGYTYDLEKAKAHLAKVKDADRELTIGVLAGYNQSEQAAALLQNGLTKIGIKSKLLIEPWPVVSGKMRDEAQMYDLVFLWKSTYYADPNNWVGEMYDSAKIGSRNNSWYKNPEVDKLLHEAQVSTDMEVRRANYEKASLLVMQDAAGIFVYNTKWFGPFSSKVKGVRFCPIGNGQEARWMYPAG